jgi:Mn-dependent DtxR family transcriptional regulator
MEKNDWSREKLKKYVQSEITKLFSTILDYVEVAVDGKARYKNLRSKILKVSNDSIREIHKELDSKYMVDYPLGEEIIVVDQQGK